MKAVNIGLISFLTLTIIYGVKDMSVGNIGKAIVDKGNGVIAVLFTGGNSPSNRSLPRNQGDDSETIIPIEQLEDVK